MKRLFHYQLHQYPEITYKATGAATFVMVALKSSEIPFESIGGTDIVATLRRNATKEAPIFGFPHRAGCTGYHRKGDTNFY